MVCRHAFNALPNDIISDLSKLKAFADDKLKLVQMTKCVLDLVENIMGKKENTGYQHFLISLNFCIGLLFQGC